MQSTFPRLWVHFILENQNWNDNEFTLATVYDENGNVLPTQNEKEPSSLTLDWCKRVVFKAELKPMSINRFDCKLEVKNISGRPIDKANETDAQFIFANKSFYWVFSHNPMTNSGVEVSKCFYIVAINL